MGGNLRNEYGLAFLYEFLLFFEIVRPRGLPDAGPRVGSALLFLRNEAQAERAADTSRFLV